MAGDTVNLFGSEVKRGYVIAGGLVVAVAVFYGWRKNQADQAAAASTPSAPGSADSYDVADTSADTGYYDDPYAAAGYGLATYGDTYGYGGYYAGTAAGEIAYQTNGQWAQAAEDYLSGTVGADTTTVAAALGKYITGQAITADQMSVVEQAIAFTGYPPVNGPDGYPPSIRQSPAAPTATAGQVTGLHVATADAARATVVWSPTAPAYSVHIYGLGQNATHTVTVPSAEFSGLHNGHAYDVAVTALQSVGGHQAGSAVHVTIPAKR